MVEKIRDGTVEFACYSETNSDGECKTFESGNINIHTDYGRIDIRCVDECPYCGGNHWK